MGKDLGSWENPFQIPWEINGKLDGNGLFEKKIFKIHGLYITGVFPKFEGPKVVLNGTVQDLWDKYDTYFYTGTMIEASKILYEKIKDDSNELKKYTPEQINALQQGKDKIPGKIWHHYEELDNGRPIMQLVDAEIHKSHKHTGGSYTWNERHFIEKYGLEWINARKKG